MKPLDLRFGNPGFLQELLNDTFEIRVSSATANYDQTKGSALLKELIYQLHESVGNVKNPRDYKIVIGNGCSQLLTAVSLVNPVGTYAPYWSRFDNLIPDLQLFTNEYPHHEKTHDLLITYPNNPDGKLSSKVYEAKVADASYHWPTYYRLEDKIPALDNDIILFSFSKMSGLSSNRFGWALIRDNGIAVKVAEEVELATCGVSKAAQEVALEVISSFLLDNTEFFVNSRNILLNRLNELLVVYPEHLYGKQRGMFFYVRDPGHSFEKLNIEGYRGDVFKDSSSMIRLNIGCYTWEFEELLRRLKA